MTPIDPDRRRLLLAAGASLAAPGLATAQAPIAYPSKPVRLIVPFPAGVSPDVVARQWADRFAKLAGQPVVVENRACASTIIATEFVASAPADGHTLLWTVNNTY